MFDEIQMILMMKTSISNNRILRLDNLRSTGAKSINPCIIRKLIECVFKHPPISVKFTLNIFKIMVFGGRSVFWSVHWITDKKIVKSVQRVCKNLLWSKICMLERSYETLYAWKSGYSIIYMGKNNLTL